MCESSVKVCGYRYGFAWFHRRMPEFVQISNNNKILIDRKPSSKWCVWKSGQWGLTQLSRAYRSTKLGLQSVQPTAIVYVCMCIYGAPNRSFNIWECEYKNGTGRAWDDSYGWNEFERNLHEPSPNLNSYRCTSSWDGSAPCARCDRIHGARSMAERRTRCAPAT